MPNPKTDRNFDSAKAVKEVKAGKVEFRVDKTGSFTLPSARSNSARAIERKRADLIDTVIKARPLQ
jgi:large subunit ribosomal protein L1